MLLEADIAPCRTKTAEHLFEPIRLGRMMLPHRVAMAPLTRSRARQPGNVPTPLNAAYYVQRSSRRADHQRGDPGLDARPGLRVDTRYSQPRAD